MKQPNTPDLAPAIIAALTLLPVLIAAAAIAIGARP